MGRPTGIASGRVRGTDFGVTGHLYAKVVAKLDDVTMKTGVTEANKDDVGTPVEVPVAFWSPDVIEISISQEKKIDILKSLLGGLKKPIDPNHLDIVYEVERSDGQKSPWF